MLERQWRPAIVLTIALMVITGLVYPGLITALGQMLFRDQANGSLVRVDGKVVGSKLIGQSFTQPRYFHSRPSAAGAGYDAAASAGSNKGPTDLKLADTLIADVVAEVRQQNNISGAVPADAVTRSASGLDPHISPAYAELQIARVALARASDPARVRALVQQHTEGRQLGFLGEPRVNVLLLNLALDRELR